MTPYGRIVKIQFNDNNKVKTYLLQSEYMEHAGWNVQILSETDRVEKFVIIVVMMLSSIFILGGLLHLLVWQRKQRLIEAKRFEEQSRRVLEDANERLESRVIERTAELTQTNVLLRQEIDERRKAEVALKNTNNSENITNKIIII